MIVSNEPKKDCSTNKYYDLSQSTCKWWNEINFNSIKWTKNRLQYKQILWLDSSWTENLSGVLLHLNHITFSFSFFCDFLCQYKSAITAMTHTRHKKPEIKTNIAKWNLHHTNHFCYILSQNDLAMTMSKYLFVLFLEKDSVLKR